MSETTTTKASRKRGPYGVPTAHIYSVYLALGTMQKTAEYFGFASHVNVSQRLKQGGYRALRRGRPSGYTLRRCSSCGDMTTGRLCRACLENGETF